ncbi:MAG: hypothetical protein AAB267_09705 [Candidatus Desantisbacteria bacterium]
MNALCGKDLLTGQKISGANRLLGFFGAGAFSTLGKAANTLKLGKIGNLLTKADNLWATKKLNSLANLTMDANRISKTCGWDFVNETKTSGINQLMAGLDLLKATSTGNNRLIDRSIEDKLDGLLNKQRLDNLMKFETFYRTGASLNRQRRPLLWQRAFRTRKNKYRHICYGPIPWSGNSQWLHQCLS